MTFLSAVISKRGHLKIILLGIKKSTDLTELVSKTKKN